MIASILIISFLFESIYTNIVPVNYILMPLFLLTSLNVLYPYFKNKKTNFIIVCTIVGLFYDIALINVGFINTICLFFIGYLIIALYRIISYNIFGVSLVNIVIIMFYMLISYLLLCIVDYLNFNIKILIKGMYSSLISNAIFVILLFIIVKKLSILLNKKLK